MNSKESQKSKDITLTNIVRKVHYWIYGSYKAYEFQAQMCVNDGCCSDGIDDGHICKMYIQHIDKANKNVKEEVFDFDFGWNTLSDKKDDINAYKFIRSFLEKMSLSSTYYTTVIRKNK